MTDHLGMRAAEKINLFGLQKEALRILRPFFFYCEKNEQDLESLTGEQKNKTGFTSGENLDRVKDGRNKLESSDHRPVKMQSRPISKSGARKVNK